MRIAQEKLRRRSLRGGCLKIKKQSPRSMARAHQLAAIQNASHLREPSCSQAWRAQPRPRKEHNKRSMAPINTTIFDQTDCLLAPGELVQQSGIYEICHQDEPRASVILMRNTIFPYCRRCGESVRYKILEIIPHISEDPDFQEDPLGTDNPSHKMMIPTPTFPMQLGRAHGFRFQQEILQAWADGSSGGDL